MMTSAHINRQKNDKVYCFMQYLQKHAWKKTGNTWV